MYVYGLYGDVTMVTKMCKVKKKQPKQAVKRENDITLCKYV